VPTSAIDSLIFRDTFASLQTRRRSQPSSCITSNFVPRARTPCGAVQYEVKGTPTAFDLCHCSRCREASGSAFVAELVFKAAQFEWVTGGSLVKTYEAPVRMKPPGYRRT
jgi:hypothetical protein